MPRKLTSKLVAIFRFTKFHLILFTLVLATVLTISVTEATWLTHSTVDAASTQGPSILEPVVGYSLKNDVSPALADMPPIPPDVGETTRQVPMLSLPKGLRGITAPVAERDPVLQEQPGRPNMPSPSMNFEGVNNINGVLPPDTQGDIGYDPATGKKYYVQWVNLSFAIWDVTTGTLSSEVRVYGPVNGNTLWQGFGGPCETTNHGDPITLYDPLAHRWLMSQFSVNGPYYQCIAISTSANPTGSWYRYAFLVSNTKMNDYPKFGVWPDAYYMSVNQFTGGSSWGGAGVFAFDRANMLSGNPATFVYFDLYSVNPSFGGMLPADLDGDDPPPAGSPDYFAEVDDSSSIAPDDAMRLWEFRVSWTTPASSTFGLNGQPNVVLPVASFTPLCPFTSNCVPQPGTSQGLDAIGDRLMYRLQYRNFGDYETLVTNHTVDAGSARAGVRWYEIRKSGGAWSLYQQGTYAPADAEHRWMGSVALDHKGNMAVGYSVSSSSVYPSIRYTGRLLGDPLDTLPQGETSIIAGGGSQTHSAARWGDYSMMGVDPKDDCTFWYTQEYVQTTGVVPWQTRLASFKFPSCTKGPQGTLRGAVSNVSNGNLIVGAQVQATASLTQTGSTTSGAGGAYSMQLPVGVYTVTASAYGYLPNTIRGVSVVSGTTTTQNISLTPVPMRIVSGTVHDALAGWPLYAHLTIRGNPNNPPAPYNDLWTNPVTGFYSVTLAEGITYTFDVDAWVTGYNALTRAVGPLTSNRTENMGLSANTATCNAPGYVAQSYTSVFTEDFESGYAGWTMSGLWHPERQTGTCGARVAPFPSPYNDAYFGVDATCTYNTGAVTTGALTLNTPIALPTSGYPQLAFWSYEQTECNGDCTWDNRYVEISTNGGGSWTTLGEGITETTWYQRVFSLAPYVGSNVLLRFRFDSVDSVGNNHFGWMVDNVSIQMVTCLPIAGGLVVGNTYDANTSNPLAGAQVTNESGRTFTTLATADPAADDSFYTLFSPAGTHVFTTTRSGGYGAAVATRTVVLSSTIRQNFSLPAGRLSSIPPSLQAVLSMGQNATLPLTLTNSGGLPASFTLVELDKGVSPLGPFQSPAWVVKPFKQNRSTSEGLGIQPAPPAPPYAAGDVIRSWSSGLVSAWGITYDAADNTVWVASPAPSWNGNNTFYEYTPSGALTGRSRPFLWNPIYGPADAAYNWNTGMLWVMNVSASSTDNCIYELDPASGYTGTRLCPGGGFVTSQRGLAYDPSTDTWYAGSWNDSMIHHFDSTGVMLDEVNVGLGIAGLAYNPDTQHLFVMVDDSTNPVYVLDAANNYAALGQFTISGFGAYSGAGLEIDCDGHLWAVNQNTETVYEIDSGEATSVCARDVPWLSESPISGTLAALSSQPISVRFDAGVSQITQPGQYHAQLKIKHSTPYNVANIPMTMTVTVPARYGKLVGTVTGLAHCDAPGAPLDRATVFVQSGSGLTWTLTTNISGTYTLWSNQANSPLTLTTSHAGYITQTVTGVNVTAQQTTTQNLNLRLDAPCVGVNPNTLNVSVALGLSKTVPLTLTNTGAGAATFEFLEENGNFNPLAMMEGQSAVEASRHQSQPTSVLTAYPIRVAIYDHGATDDISYFVGGNQNNWSVFKSILETDPESRFVVTVVTDLSPTTLAGFSRLVLPDNGVPDTYLTAVSDWFTSGKRIIAVDSAICYAAYSGFMWPASAGSNGLDTYWDYSSGSSDQEVLVIDKITEDYTVGSILSSVSSDAQILSTQLPTDALQLTGKQSDHTRIYVSSREVLGKGTIVVLGPYAMSVESDLYALVRDAVEGTAGGTDVPWLSESPISGTVPAHATMPIAITFDAGVVTQPGQYVATLEANSSDPIHPSMAVPVTMTVNTPATWGKLMGTVTGLAHCDAPGAPLDRATVFVQSGSGLTWTLTTNISGTYQIWLNAANSPLTITTGHAGYITQTVTALSVTAQQTTTQNLSLRLDAPCVKASPTSLQANLNLGVSQTVFLTMANTGAAATTFQLAEVDEGFEPIVIGPYKSIGSGAGAVELQEQPHGMAPAPSQVQGSVVVVQEDKARRLDSPPKGRAPLRSGGPDPFGYTYKDSQEPGGPSYAWIEIAPPAGGSGIALTALSGIDDGYYWPLPLPFAFNFYGTSYPTLAVASNGTIYFEEGYLGSFNTTIPSSNGYGINRFIAHLWSDLYVSPGAVYYQAEGDRFIIEYYQVSACCVSPSSGTWEIVLFANGSMLFQYKDVIFGDSRDYGAVATIGIQGDITTGLQYSYDTAALVNDLAICFAYPGQPSNCSTDVPWLSESPVVGDLGAPATKIVSVTFDADAVRQPGTYSAALSIMSADPVSSMSMLPVTMTVTIPSAWGQAHGRVYGLGHCDTAPALLMDAQVMITTSTGVTHIFTQRTTDPWSWWAAPGPMTITADAPGYATQTIVTQIQTGQGINQDFNLRWLHNCGSVAPSPVTLALPPDFIITVPISLANRGVLSWTWALSEASTWLSISGPLAGTTGPDSSLPSQLTVDTTGMLLGATYTALVNVTHDDDQQPNPLPLVVQVTIVPGPFKVYLPVVFR